MDILRNSNPVVTWSDPVVSDNIDRSPQVSCIPRSDFYYADGNTTITCEAVDEAGNRANCTFLITLGM